MFTVASSTQTYADTGVAGSRSAPSDTMLLRANIARSSGVGASSHAVVENHMLSAWSLSAPFAWYVIGTWGASSRLSHAAATVVDAFAGSQPTSIRANGVLALTCTKSSHALAP